MRHCTVPVFVPFAGCPQRCVYCDQRSIAATMSVPSPEQTTAQLEEACSKRKIEPGTRGTETLPVAQHAQIAFFGGSFTAIPLSEMCALLTAAQPFLADGRFDSIRISTRPDAIDAQILQILQDFGVATVELGAQSADDGVLEKNCRGHTFADTMRAAQMIRTYGFELVLQMMTGLYGSTPQIDLRTAEALLALHPDGLRVYPTVVLETTELARLWRSGAYVPPTLEQTVAVCAQIRRMADKAGVPVIRMGLHAEPETQMRSLAGPYHPAFGELVESRIFFEEIFSRLEGQPAGNYTVFVAPGRISAAVGHQRCNSLTLAQHGWQIRVRTDSALSGYAIKVEKEPDRCF